MVHGFSPAQRTPTVMRPHRRAPLGMNGSIIVQAARPRGFCCAADAAAWRVADVRAIVAGIGAGVDAVAALVTIGLPFAPNCGGSPREARLSKPPVADASAGALTGALRDALLGALAATGC